MGGGPCHRLPSWPFWAWISAESATSLAAIIVTAAVGSGTYALHGEVSWAGAALLVAEAGALAGSQIGVLLLRRSSTPSRRTTVPTIFVIISQYLHVPTREGAVSLTPARAPS